MNNPTNLSALSVLSKALVSSLGLLLLQPLSAVAGTITFFDLTDNVTVGLSSDIVNRVNTSGCPGVGEICTVLVSPPSLPGFYLGAVLGGFSDTDIREIDNPLISDTIRTTFRGIDLSPSTITFTSDIDNGIGLPPGGNLIVEDGTIQHVIDSDVTWFFTNINSGVTTQVVDQIFFQSDVVEVPPVSTPEPGSMLGIFAFGTLSLVSALKRKQRHSKFTEKEFSKAD